MTEHERDVNGSGAGEPTEHTHRDSERPLGHSRRRLIETLAVVGPLSLAGCGDRTSFTPTGGAGGGPPPTANAPSDDLPTVRNQTFRAPINHDPAKTSFYSRHSLDHLLQPTFATIAKENASAAFQRFIWETGVWADGLWVGTGNIHYNWIEEPIEITPTEVSITIRDDARWSDGHQITGKDIACIPLHYTIRKGFHPYYAEDGQNKPETIYDAVDNFEITNQSVTYRSSRGFFDTFWNLTIEKRWSTFYGPHLLPTHIEPYDAYANAVIDTARRAQLGEINPWDYESDDPNKQSLVRKHLAKRKYVAKFSKPENVLATGAWDLVELNGSDEFVFEKNDHHRHADAINFDRVIYKHTPSDRRLHSSLKADRLDYGARPYGDATPQEIVESFPAHIKQLLIPGGIYTGNELGITFTHPGMGNRKVRAAIMYALDHEAIAANTHPTVARPVETPGGNCWDATDYASQEWIDENLITYTQNQEKAAALMRNAGYTREREQWSSAEGELLTLTLATPSDTPSWESTVASHLSEFGIQTSVKTLSEATFRERTDTGEFPLWPTSLNSATNKAPATLFVWNDVPQNRHKYGIYPEEQFEAGTFSRWGTPLPKTEERWSVFSIEAPPIGQPDGPLQKYHPSALSLMFASNPPEEEFRGRVKTGLWVANWFLPTLPITKKREQHFIDSAHWLWPTDTNSWKTFTGGGPRFSWGIFASGNIWANPDNPEGGASVKHG